MDLAGRRALTPAARQGGDRGNASAEKVDVRDEESVTGLMNRVAEQHWKIDGLHNDTSCYLFAQRDTHIVELGSETWEYTLQTGLRGYMYTIKHAVPHMAR